MRAAAFAWGVCLVLAPVPAMAQGFAVLIPDFRPIASSEVIRQTEDSQATSTPTQEPQTGSQTTDPKTKDPQAQNPQTQAPVVPPSQPKVHRHVGFRSLVTDLGGDFRHLPSRETAVWLSAAGALALAAHPIDDTLNGRLQGRQWVDSVYKPGKVVGYAWAQMGASSLTYVYGRLATKPKVAHLAMDLLRAQMMSQTLTYGLKSAVRRQRPDRSSGYAFPSGHSSDTFATATVLQQHLGWKAAVPGYLIASYVASSRLHDNRHFLSDVIFGSAIGIVSGRTVVRHPSSEYRYWIEPQVGAGRVAVVVARR